MTESEWNKMERAIPVASWTYLDMSCDKQERMKTKIVKMIEQMNR